MKPFALAAWFALYLSAGFASLVESGALGRARTPDLSDLPAVLGPFSLGPQLAFDAAALGETPPERFTFRPLTTAGGLAGRLFVAYYERAQRWSGRPHDVEKCFEAAGWRELSNRRLVEEEHRPWVRTFERRGPRGALETIQVVHWLERPGPDQDALAPAELGARLASGRGFRPDVASVYFEFPAEGSPPDAELARAVADLSQALEERW